MKSSSLWDITQCVPMKVNLNRLHSVISQMVEFFRHVEIRNRFIQQNIYFRESIGLQHRPVSVDQWETIVRKS
jgi:hypothetical protein